MLAVLIACPWNHAEPPQHIYLKPWRERARDCPERVFRDIKLPDPLEVSELCAYQNRDEQLA
jgi:hypothetical protein